MLMPQRNESFFEYWLSFSPLAPFFGVNWRFDSVSPDGAFSRLGDVGAQMARAAVRSAPAQAPAPIRRAVEDAAKPDRDGSGPVGARPRMLYDAAPAEADDLTAIKGVGPKLAAKLNELGVYRLEQIAGFDGSDLAWIDRNLGGVRGRAMRGDWAGQARSLLG